MEKIRLDDGHYYNLGSTPQILTQATIPAWKAINSGGWGTAFLKDGYLCSAYPPSEKIRKGILSRFLRKVSDEIYKFSTTQPFSFAGALFPTSIHFGTYEWKGKASGIEANKFLGWGFHRYFCQYSDGIELFWDGVATPNGWRLWTSKEGKATTSTIEDVDFGEEHTFRLEWIETEVRLYIDSKLKETSKTNVPTCRLYPFMTVIIKGETALDSYVYGKDWRKIT